MENTAERAIAIVGVGAVLPDAPNVASFWTNIKNGRYSINEVTPDRWDPAFYFDPDHAAPDKTYSKIGGWVREHVWDPMKWRLAIPPRVVSAMDESQKWAISCTREALEDYGYPGRPLNLDRTAVILGNAMAGEKHYFTALRLYFPEYAHELSQSASFASLPAKVREQITRELHDRMTGRVQDVTEDTMPGELSNCIAGRIANTFNFHGPNYVVDAACASAMAAFDASVEGLIERAFDVAVTGGIDRNMGASTYIKFCKVGALSATGTRPYAEGADGFVMGEGAAIFLLKRLADAERDGDKIYAVLRGIAGSSDGKGKGITAPNPIGQKLSVERAWENAGLSPATATYIEGHGTSTAVGDVVEVQSMAEVLAKHNAAKGSVALGSVKSNIGHLKAAAGAAGLLKAALALRDKVIPPSVHCEHRNPDIDFAHLPLYVNTELKRWDVPADTPRRAGVSAFGFGGTNFHVVLEEHLPHKLNGNGKRSITVGEIPAAVAPEVIMNATTSSKGSDHKAPLRGAMVVGASSVAELLERLKSVQKSAGAGNTPALAPPTDADLQASERIAIDYADATELAEKSAKAIKALASDHPPVWKALRAQGIYRGHGPAPKVAFLYTGQGSQYVNMLRPLLEAEPIVKQTFEEADRVMAPLLGKPLTDFIFVNQSDLAAVAKAEDDLRQTAITQPAVLATDEALTRLLAAYGIRPDMTMGHSLGEYGALVASGAIPFNDALEAVSARGRGMTSVAMNDNGKMAAIIAPMTEVERILKTIDGYVVIANINSNSQAVIGGASKAVEQAMNAFRVAGYDPVELSVSHAFHTSIVAGAGGPLRKELERLHFRSPVIPIVANVNGQFYPMGTNVVPQMLDILTQQVAAPVQFVKGLHTLYEAGARVFVEVGPKKALQGFAEDVLGKDSAVLSIFTNHPKVGDIVAFNQALCALYGAGFGIGQPAALASSIPATAAGAPDANAIEAPNSPLALSASNGNRGPIRSTRSDGTRKYDMNDTDPRKHPALAAAIVISGAAIGLPGTQHIFDDANIARILRGDQFIDAIPIRFRQAMLDKNITRLVKSDNGGPSFESIHDMSEVIKLAARGGAFDPENEFGISSDRLAALDRVTRLAIGAGIDALRDAGIPLVMHYKTTSKGTQLPDRWAFPDKLRDDTGVIFASAFPGYDSYADEMSRYYADRSRRDQLQTLRAVRGRVMDSNGSSTLTQELDRRIAELQATIEKEPYVFDRRFLFKVLSMGHSQFAEFIGARGPNTQLNSACATTTQAVSLAEDWIHAGRCRRVIIISADDITSDHTLEWFGAGFLASGAAATDEVVEEAAIPFDRRRHGLIIGMGAAALVVESADAAAERGITPICEVLSTVTANSAFHGTRLDVQHIGQMMETVITQAESRFGISRREIAPHTVFVSHETYTPARGGSASAEIHALRRVFGDVADQIVIANTKGFTGHAMATGIEDVVAVKSLETSCVPPVANFKEVDLELGPLNLSKGGIYPVEYALRLGAGFGSQISMTLMRWVKTQDGVHRTPDAVGYSYRVADVDTWTSWLQQISGQKSADLEVVRRTLRVKDHAERVLSSVPQQSSPSANKIEPATPVTPVIATEPAVAAAASSDAPESDSVKERVLALVAEKTGYPPNMLDLDLDLEADLGVDTVKQAEVFAAVREAYGITRDDQIKLRDFPTLAHVIRFVLERRPDVQTASVPITVHQTAVAPMSENAAISVNDESVKDRILSLVVEKTGYPKDMLDLDLDLEADLGVDTVKQAEMFAAIRAAYNIPRDENLKLRDYPTLAHVIRFVYAKRPDLTATGIEQAVPATLSSTTLSVNASTQTTDSVKEMVLAIVAEKTGYPQDMLDLDLDLEADLGVDTVKQAEMFAAIRALYNIPRDENLKLRDYPTLARVIQFVNDKRPDLAAVVTAPPLTASVMPVTTPVPTVDSIKEKVLAIVAEKTGYPPDMLDLDLDLEADLGVDTVKQAEMFAAVRAAYNIPRDENLKLRDFPTLAHVIKFASDRQPKTNVHALTKPVVANSSTPPPTVPKPQLASFDAVDLIPRRVPTPVLRPPLSLCKSTGVKLASGSRVVIVPDKGGVSEALVQRLQSVGVETLRLSPSLDSDALTNQLKTWLAAGPINGVYWLPALDPEGSLQQMDINAWRENARVRVKSLYLSMRTLYEHVALPGTFLVSATRLGGQHGYEEAGASAPMGGAVTGFTKAYKRERMDALVKAVDFETNRNKEDVADLLIAETLHDTGALEIGYKNGLRWTIALQEESCANGQPGLTLNHDSVILITGAAGSIVSAITADLAAASGGIFYLLDMVPEPDANNPDLERFRTDKEGLKRDLFTRMQNRGERATPALIEKELAALERAQAACTAIDAVRKSGGTPFYFSVNLTDSEAVAKVIDQVRQRSGRIDVLLHAAGVERSHVLPDKDPRELDLVFDVKSDGWFNLLHAIGDMPLGATVAFSSIAGRFGNGGQTDYSSANDLLCKISSSFRTTRPNTRGIAIDWTAWGGIGMATRGSIPKMMELAGIDMLPPEAGIPFIRRELITGSRRGEIVLGQRLGALLKEWDATGGLDLATWETSAQHHGPMLGKIISITNEHGLTIETTLNPKEQPFLHDHQIDNTAVLPGVMGIEAFVEAALSITPGLTVAAIEDVNFLAPFKFYRNEPRAVTLETAFHGDKNAVIADCRLIGIRTLPNQSELQVTTHFTARVRLEKPNESTVVPLRFCKPSGAPIEASEIYRLYFHGPAYQVLERAWWDGTRIVGLFNHQLPQNHTPSARALSAAPRLIELCFQTAGLWEMGIRGRMGLPQHVDQIHILRSPEHAQSALYAFVTPNAQRETFDAEVLDLSGNLYVQLRGYRTVALQGAVDPNHLKALQESMALEAAVA